MIDKAVMENCMVGPLLPRKKGNERLDLYIDYRHNINVLVLPRNIEEYPIKKSLLDSARNYT